MKGVSVFLFFSTALHHLSVLVSAKPLANAEYLETRDSAPFDGLINSREFEKRGNDPMEKDADGFGPEKMINTPIFIDDNEPVKRGVGDFDPEAMINRPAFVEPDDEPIKRRNDGFGFEPETIINSPRFRRRSDNRQTFYGPILNSMMHSNEKKSTNQATSDDFDDRPWPIDGLPVVKSQGEEEGSRYQSTQLFWKWKGRAAIGQI